MVCSAKFVIYFLTKDIYRAKMRSHCLINHHFLKKSIPLRLFHYLCTKEKPHIMDSFITFCKENFDLITLLVGVIGVVISVISVIYEVKQRKKRQGGKHV